MPLRSASDDRSEMLTQVLFGEIFEVLETSANWAYVRLEYDRYQGWVDPKQFYTLHEDELNRLKKLPTYYSTDLVQVLVDIKNNQMIPLVMGSHLHGLKDQRLNVCGRDYSYDGGFVQSEIETKRKLIVENAMMYLNAPYLWGGKTPFGIDCSGFTQMVYKLSGLNISRDASQQAVQGETINFLTDAIVGDLAFFDNTDGRITHVGILLGDNKIIHASGVVRIDVIDHQGIFNIDTKKYSHKLRIIKSYLL